MSVQSCSPSMEEAGSESSRKMHDKEETTSEASWERKSGVEAGTGGWSGKA